MDLDFLAGNYLYGDIPVGKEYLQNYFKKGAERAFISYYFLFYKLYIKGCEFQTFYINFCDHTGFSCSTRWVRKLLVKLSKIENALDVADKNFDPTLVGLIKSGKVSF